jgi:hypothetical protein
MKTVKDLTELKQLALSRGATVEVGASRYNTTGERVKAFPKPTPAPAPVTPEPVKAEPAPAPAPMPAPQITVDLQPVAQAQERMAQMFAQAISSMPKSAREWMFTVERDANGLLSSIRATAKD